jgi:hypothetical protein
VYERGVLSGGMHGTFNGIPLRKIIALKNKWSEIERKETAGGNEFSFTPHYASICFHGRAATVTRVLT